MVKLQRDGQGGYRTEDGRFTVRRRAVPTGARIGRGNVAWVLADTSGAEPFTRVGGFAAAATTTDRLETARMLIDSVLAAGAVKVIS